MQKDLEQKLDDMNDKLDEIKNELGKIGGKIATNETHISWLIKAFVGVTSTVVTMALGLVAWMGNIVFGK